MWQGVACLLALCLVTGVLAAPKSRALDQAPLAETGLASPIPLRRRDLLTNWRFLVFIPSIIAPSAILTAFMFHQRFLAETKGWPLELLALSITTYALTSLTTTLLTGTLVDRFGAIALSRFYLLGIAAAGAALWIATGPGAAPLFFALLGVTAGANNIVMPAVLAEMFGTRHLGRVRALAGALSVVASATTPGSVGLLFDAGISPAAVGLT